MNRVTYPLNFDMKGPEVADLHVALLFLLERGAILKDDPSAREEYVENLKTERESEWYGEYTRELVVTFQKESDLESSGKVDRPTAETLNKLVEGQGNAPNVTIIIPCQGQVVSGEVRRTDGVPLGGIRVSAFHGDGRGVRLGTDVTDAEGRYTIRYEPLPELPALDLRVVATDESGVPLATSGVHGAAKKWETIDLHVPVGSSPSVNRLGGRVLCENGMAAENLRLRLYRRNFGGTATMLSTTTTLGGGVYSLSFSTPSTALILEVRAVDGAGKETTLSKPLSVAVGETPPVVDLVAPNSFQPVESEFKQLTGDVAKVVSLQSLAGAKEDPDRQDLTVLNRTTGWDSRLLALAATAQRLAGEGNIGLSNEVLYGLLRAGMPSEKSILAQVDPEVAEEAVRMARDAGVISLSDHALAQFKTQFTTFASTERLSVQLPGSKSTYAQMLEASGLSASDRTKFATVFLDHRSGSGDLWQAAAEAGLGAPQVSTLKLQGKLAFLTGGSEKLATRIQQSVSEPAQLVDREMYLASSWVDEIHGAAGIPSTRRDNLTTADKQQLDALIPTAYTGATVEARRDLWAEDMARKVRLSYPTQLLAKRIERDNLIDLGAARENTVQLLRDAAAQGFRLGETPVQTFFATHDGARAGMSAADFEQARAQVSTLHRMAQISPGGGDSIAVLAALGTTSAFDVMAHSEDAFVELYTAKYKKIHGVLPRSEEPRLVYQKATQVSSITYNLFGIAKKLESDFPLFGMSSPAPLRDSSREQLIKQFPTMESLFGSLDYCECEHCRSVLSPAAYLVDLLQFLDPEPQVWANFLGRWKTTHGEQDYTEKYKKPYDALIARRPDLPAIPLTCENTNTALPYIDLVNEILEYYVAHGDLDAAAANDTADATTPELLAEPQNIIREAYDKLRLARYPLALPFDLWIETARAFCDAFEVPLSRLLEIFRPTNELFAPTRTYDRAAIFMESLGLSPPEIALLTDRDAPTRWYEYYGFDSAAKATTVAVDENTQQRIDLNSAKALSRRLGVSYKELAALVQTAFVNPKLAKLSVAYKLGCGLADVLGYLDPKNKNLFAQNKDLLDKERESLSKADRARYDRLTPADWEALRGFEAVEDRLRAFEESYGMSREDLEVALQAIPFPKILVLADSAASCDFDSTTFQYASGKSADGNAFLRLNLFVRLWRKLGWTIGETDAALRAFVPAESPFGDALQTGLIYIAHLKRLGEALQVGKSSHEKLSVLWSNLGTFGSGSLYAQLFLRPTILKMDDVFDHPYGDYLSAEWLQKKATERWFGVHLEEVAAGNQIDPAPFASHPRIKFSYEPARSVQRLSVQGVLTDAEKESLKALSQNPNVGPLLDAAQAAGTEYSLVKGHLVALQGALGLTAEEVRIVLEDAGKSLDTAELSLDHVSLLYRYRLFANGLKLSLPDLIALKQLSGRDPFKPLQPDPISRLNEDHPFTETLRFVKIVESIKQSSFKVEDLDYLLRHRFDETGKYRPTPDRTVALLKNLAEGIQRIRSEHPLPADPGSMSEDVLRQKLGLILAPEVVERFLAMLNGTAEFSAIKQGVAEADQLDPELFSGEPALRGIAYDGGLRHAQRLTYRGVLTDSEKLALLSRLPQSALLTELLDDVGAQARAFFDTYLLKQTALQPATGFLDEEDFSLLFEPIPPEGSLEEQQVLQRKRRARLEKAFLPLLQERLIRQFVVQSLIVDTAGDPALVEALLVDGHMLTLAPPSTDRPLVKSFVEVGTRGVNLDFLQSSDDGGVPIRTLVVPFADTGLEARPEEADTAVFEGYLEVPAAGAYRLFVELYEKVEGYEGYEDYEEDGEEEDEEDEGEAAGTVEVEGDAEKVEVEVRFEHLPGGVFWSDNATGYRAVLGNGSKEYLELKPGIAYRFSVTLRGLGAGDARLLVQGETIPKGPLSRLTLFPARPFDDAEAALGLLVKSLTLAQGLGLNERELRYLAHPDAFNGMGLSMLPLSSAEASPAEASSLFSQLLRLFDYVKARRAFCEGTDDLIEVFETWERGSTEDVYTILARLARRDRGALKAAAMALSAVPAFGDERSLLRLWEALEVIERFGAPVDSLVRWTRIVDASANPEQRFAIARDLSETIKAGFEPEAWQRIAKPIFDGLRKRQRDALSSHVMHRHGFARLEQLYEYFLIDPGMEPVVQTSRIRLAIASVQLFIQRCLLNLEVDVPPGGLVNAEHWEWMKRYRVWEANRKIFLFPENWLEPEFRDDKTHLFQELESALLSGDVSNDLAEDAFLAYLRNLEELARLNIVAMHIEEKEDLAQNTLHVIGRTYAEPHKYFYRRYVAQMWTPWEPVTAEIEGDHLAPVIWRGRLYLFWVTFIEKPTPSSGGTRSFRAGDRVTVATESELEAQLHWSEYLNGEWLTRESGGQSAMDGQRVVAPWRTAPSGGLSVSVQKEVSSTTVELLAKGVQKGVVTGQNAVPKDKRIGEIFVHVSKEYDGKTGEEGGVFVHLGAPFKYAFYLAGRNSLPERRARAEAPKNPYGSNVKNATQYTGLSGKAFTVQYQSRRTTSQSGTSAKSETLPILAKTGRHSILPADNKIELHPDLTSISASDPAVVKAAIESGLSEIATLTKPIFYQDDRNTLFVEPSVTERTVEKWEEWVTPMPRPVVERDDFTKLKVVLDKTFIVKQVPILDPAGPIIREKIIPEHSIRHVDDGRDWLMNDGTAVLYDNHPIGALGRLDVRALASDEIATAVASGDVAVQVHPASSLATGDTRVLVGSANALAQAGLSSAAGGLNVIGGAGLNVSLGEHLVESSLLSLGKVRS